MSVCVCVTLDVGVSLYVNIFFPSVFWNCLWFLCLYSPIHFFQVRTLASAGGPDNLVMLDPGKYKSRSKVPEPVGDGSPSNPKWQVGEQEFEAFMRMLDNLVSTKKEEKGRTITKQIHLTAF